ncbi:MAG: hypothetical protein SangKO_011260 [Sandaracinaceae bacterium]
MVSGDSTWLLWVWICAARELSARWMVWAGVLNDQSKAVACTGTFASFTMPVRPTSVPPLAASRSSFASQARRACIARAEFRRDPVMAMARRSWTE